MTVPHRETTLDTRAHPDQPAAFDRASVGTRLRSIRRGRGWSQHRLIYAMREVARTQMGRELPSYDSLKAMLSRWENDRRAPSAYNLGLLCAALRVPPAALGTDDSPRRD